MTKTEQQELLYTCQHLGGEDCIAEFARLINYPEDEIAKQFATIAMLRFYANVKYLADRIESILQGTPSKITLQEEGEPYEKAINVMNELLKDKP